MIDDKSKRDLKKMGLWQYFKDCKIGGIDKLLTYKNYVVFWFGNIGDSGLHIYQCTDEDTQTALLVRFLKYGEPCEQILLNDDKERVNKKYSHVGLRTFNNGIDDYTDTGDFLVLG